MSAKEEALSKTYTNYATASGKLKSLISRREEIMREVAVNREIRYMPSETGREKREKGEILGDETYIPSRMIDSSIRREQPQFLNYLTQPKRSLVFTPVDGPFNPLIEKLEIDFTKKARYEGWLDDHIRVIDGSQTHGLDFVRVDFDEDFPGHFSVNHVGRENLIFDPSAEDLESQEFLLEVDSMTGLELLNNIEEFNFNREVVDKILGDATNKEGSDKESPDLSALNQSYTIYVVHFKDIDDGIVYKAWHYDGATAWLSKPRKLFMGRRDFSAEIVDFGESGLMDYPPLFESEYPYYDLVYTMSENKKLGEIKGRVALDEADQEAASALLSCIVNQSIRSSNMYGAPAKLENVDPGKNKAPKLTSQKIYHGKLFDQPINFQNLPGPDGVVLQAYQALVGKNAGEQSRVDFAVKNRQDSRKTATEIKSANKESEQLASVQITLFSQFILKVYSRCYAIYRNRILSRRLIVPDEDILTLAQEAYILKPSGDVDVIKRAEKLEKQFQFWPVVQATPVAQVFLQDMIKNNFPEEAERYLQAMAEGEEKNKLILDMQQAILLLATDDEGNVKPEFNEFIGQLNILGQRVEQTTGLNAQLDELKPSGESGQAPLPTMGSEQPSPQIPRQAPGS